MLLLDFGDHHFKVAEEELSLDSGESAVRTLHNVVTRLRFNDTAWLIDVREEQEQWAGVVRLYNFAARPYSDLVDGLGRQVHRLNFVGNAGVGKWGSQLMFRPSG